MSISKCAEEALKWFYWTGTDHPDMRENIWVTKKDRPDWVINLVCEAHDKGSVLPDDFIYEYVVDALDYLSDADNDPDDYDPESDIYNGDLLKWLASSLARADYVDVVRRESGDDYDLMQLIGLGQAQEKRDVYEAVLTWLQEHEDEIDPADNDDDYDEIAGTIFDDSDEPVRL
jgi:hypothetical protein